MKACETYWKNNKHDLRVMSSNRHKFISIGWRAALEWVLDSAGGNCDWDKIEEELGEE